MYHIHSKWAILPLESPSGHGYWSKKKLQILQYLHRKFSPGAITCPCSLPASTQLDRTDEKHRSSLTLLHIMTFKWRTSSLLFISKVYNSQTTQAFILELAILALNNYFPLQFSLELNPVRLLHNFTCVKWAPNTPDISTLPITCT